MANPTQELADATVAALLALGVGEVVFCGGARNAPLAKPLLVSGLRIHSHFDERAAAFYALGRTRALEAPVALVTTSGTAVAECLPAMIEAHYQGLPLIVISADRPRRFRGSGAPQAIEQVAIFAPYAQFCADVEDLGQLEVLAAWRRNCPLQINLCFEEPKAIREDNPNEPADHSELIEALSTPPAGPGESELLAASIQLGSFVNPCADGELLVLVGDLLPSERLAVLDFLYRLQAPFWAEASSGLREEKSLGPVRIEGGEEALQEMQWKKVLRLGGVPSCRFWRDLEDRFDTEVLSVSRSGYRGLGRGGEIIALSPALLLPLCGIRRQGRAIEALRRDKSACQQLDKQLVTEPQSELAWVRRLAETIADDSLVFLGNSLPIREWNLAAPRLRRSWRVHASRGANGIDGQLATFLGLATSIRSLGSAGQFEREAWCVLGDLSAFYDVSSLTLAHKLPEQQPLRLVVLNNGGGGIFRQLAALQAEPEVLKLVENPHQQSLGPWAKAAGWKYHRWDYGDPLPSHLPNRVLIEISC